MLCIWHFVRFPTRLHIFAQFSTTISLTVQNAYFAANGQTPKTIQILGIANLMNYPRVVKNSELTRASCSVSFVPADAAPRPSASSPTNLETGRLRPPALACRGRFSTKKNTNCTTLSYLHTTIKYSFSITTSNYIRNLL